MPDPTKEPTEKTGQWIWPALFVAVLYRPLDTVGDWLLEGYTSFFQALCRSIDPLVPQLFAMEAPAPAALPTGGDVTDGGVFLILCWLIYAHWPKQTGRQRRAAVRRWLRQPFSQGTQTLLLIAALPFLTYLYTGLLQDGFMLAHPFVMRWLLGLAFIEIRGFVAWQQHRGRTIARQRRKATPKPTMLDGLVS